MLGSAGSALFNTSLNQVNRIEPEARGVHHLTIHIMTKHRRGYSSEKVPHEPWLNNWLNNWLDCLISIKAKILFGQNISQFVHALQRHCIYTLYPVFQFGEGSIITLPKGRPWSVFKGCFALIICCRQAGLVTSYPE